MCELYSADSLLDMSLVNLRKLWKVMFSAVWENEGAIFLIRNWLQITYSETEAYRLSLYDGLLIAYSAAEEKRRAMAEWGSALEERVKRAKQQVEDAKHGNNRKRIEEATENLKNVEQPITEYRHAVKNVTQAEMKSRNVKTRIERLKKLQAIFDEMAEKARI